MTVQYDKVSTILPIIEEMNRQAVVDGLHALVSGNIAEAHTFTIEAEAYKRLFTGLTAMIEAGVAD